ncbi:MAG: hypothetical protein H7Z41_19300 [Cytophagales bacterium]|nr:hypothetical protein [Armatimonadota bacterium]
MNKHDSADPPTLGDPCEHDGGSKTEAIAALKPKREKREIWSGAAANDLSLIALRNIVTPPRVACILPGSCSERRMTANLAPVRHDLSGADTLFVRETLNA